MSVKNAIASIAESVLEEVAGELEAQVKRNTKVGKVSGGKTKNNWKHKVLQSKEGYTAYIGNNQQTAIWLEFGTGEYALEGKGRKGGWWIPIGGAKGISEEVANAYHFPILGGKNGKKFAFTRGMLPQRPFWKAYTSMKNKIIARIQNALKEL